VYSGWTTTGVSQLFTTGVAGRVRLGVFESLVKLLSERVPATLLTDACAKAPCLVDPNLQALPVTQRPTQVTLQFIFTPQHSDGSFSCGLTLLYATPSASWTVWAK
jgi:hypothetical protein